jgi:hypothetical protein
MSLSPLAGKPAPKEILVDLGRLEKEYFECRPDFGDPAQRVSFGTSGHRGSPFAGSFTEAHIGAITQASVTVDARKEPLVRSTWAKTRMRFPGRHNALPSKSSPRTVWKP